MNMMHIAYRFLAAILFAALTNQAAVTVARRPMPASPVRHIGHARVNSGYGKLPLAFEPNMGQTDARVRFLARSGGMTAFFTDTGTAMVLSRSRQAKTPDGPGWRRAPAGEVEQAVVRMKLEGAAQARQVSGVDKLPGISNYFIGNDPAKWRTDVPHYGRIQYEGVYPGVDVVWYGNQRRLEYDFVIGPGADPKQIQVAWEGVESLKVEPNGDLVLRTALGEMRQQKPKVYQEIAGRRVEVAAQYSVVARNRVGFQLARYDRRRELRIDPVVLLYSTYLGGSSDDVGNGIAVDAAGSAYVTGYTMSTDFPTQSAYQGKNQGDYDAFVTKLTPTGDALVYSTYLGGSGLDESNGIAVDGTGAAYIAGVTFSPDFPTQAAYQSTLHGPSDAFVAKLSPSGSALVYSTYLGGSGGDQCNGIAVDGQRAAYVTGWTWSANFPTVSGYQMKPGWSAHGTNAFVAKLTPAGSALTYSTYLGGSGTDYGQAIAVDGAGSAYVTGYATSTNFPTESPYQAKFQGGASDAFVTKLTPAGTGLVYSTYLGGSDPDQGTGIAVDGSGSAYVTGWTGSGDFPTQSPFQATLKGSDNVFLTKLTPAGTSLVYSTYLGGSGGDFGLGIALDGAGAIYLTGFTSSTDFPTQTPYETEYLGNDDVFVTKMTPAGNALIYSTFLGGNGVDQANGIAVDSADSAYITGFTTSSGFPTQSPLQPADLGGDDVFVTKMNAPTIAEFNDVPSSATYFEAANLMLEYGVTTGCVESNDPATRSYCPDDNVTRQEMAAFIVRAVTGTVNPAIYNTKPYFEDVPASNSFFPHIQKLMELGITTGCSQSPALFCPTDTIPRWEMAIFMVRARLMLFGNTDFSYSIYPYFADVPTNVEGNGQPFPFIQRAYEEHVTNGCGSNPLVYCPDELVTRGQMASFIMRGLFDETTILGPTAPQLTGVIPNAVAAKLGSAITVTITAVNTSFKNKDTVTVPSGMLTVSNVLVNSAGSITATLTVNSTAVAGPQALMVTSGGQNLTLPLAIKVGTY
ncbi:MAG: SBBP repeat-containing protein [Bryobacteraceae bacterium]